MTIGFECGVKLLRWATKCLIELTFRILFSLWRDVLTAYRKYTSWTSDMTLSSGPAMPATMTDGEMRPDGIARGIGESLARIIDHQLTLKNITWRGDAWPRRQVSLSVILNNIAPSTAGYHVENEWEYPGKWRQCHSSWKLNLTALAVTHHSTLLAY